MSSSVYTLLPIVSDDTYGFIQFCYSSVQTNYSTGTQLEVLLVTHNILHLLKAALYFQADLEGLRRSCCWIQPCLEPTDTRDHLQNVMAVVRLGWAMSRDNRHLSILWCWLRLPSRMVLVLLHWIQPHKDGYCWLTKLMLQGDLAVGPRSSWFWQALGFWETLLFGSKQNCSLGRQPPWSPWAMPETNHH